MFNPHRLKIARHRCKLTQKALSEQTGLSQITVSRLESAVNKPEQETVSRIANFLGFPVGFFYGDDLDELTADSASFRSLSGMTARERDAALATGAIAYLLDDWVQERFNLPDVEVADLGFEGNPDNAARMLRQYWGLGEKPIQHMIKLLESKGVRVFSISENTINVDAFSCWRNGIPYIFLNKFKSAERSRFDAAHELGHLVLHKHGGTRHNRNAEREANEFASAFLMPEMDVVPHFSNFVSLEEIIEKKRRWRVSVAALAYRLHRLGSISNWIYHSLCIQISRNGYRNCEPNGISREKSIVWSQVLENLWLDRITKHDIANELFVPIEEIEGILFGDRDQFQESGSTAAMDTSCAENSVAKLANF